MRRFLSPLVILVLAALACSQTKLGMRTGLLSPPMGKSYGSIAQADRDIQAQRFFVRRAKLTDLGESRRKSSPVLPGSPH